MQELQKQSCIVSDEASRLAQQNLSMHQDLAKAKNALLDKR